MSGFLLSPISIYQKVSFQNNFYSINSGDNSIYKHNLKDKFQTFYNNYYPFIIEYVKSSSISNNIFEDLSLQTRARKWDSVLKTYKEEDLITFNKLIINNDKQCSGELDVVVKDTKPNPEDWYSQQVVNIDGQVIVSREEKNWNVNDFRDYVIDYNQPLFRTDWNAIKLNYYIDKVVNNSIISFSKSWDELQSFRDKYIVIRLKFDNFDDVNLTMNYSVETEQISS